MILHYRDTGGGVLEVAPLVFLHGLFGSSANWGRIVKAFASSRRCLVPDLRNHGRSFHADAVDYRSQSADLVAMLDALGVERSVLIGHSMGAKVAMLMAFLFPHRVERLVCVDMAPKVYYHRFDTMDAIRNLDLTTLTNRVEADKLLTHEIQNKAVRNYLLQNLIRDKNRWRWRINLEAMSRGVADILDFPKSEDSRYEGATLFIYGRNSTYVSESDRKEITALFPHSQMIGIENAGHWLYTDRPEEFIAQLKTFLA